MIKPGNRIRTSFLRLRHRRGHGVHSPFVYALARNVFAGKDDARESELYEALRAMGIKPRTADEIARLYTHTDYERFEIVERLPHSPADGTFYFLRPGRTHDLPAALPDSLRVAVCMPGRHGLKPEVRALTIGRKGYTVCFYDAALPAQHFIL